MSMVYGRNPLVLAAAAVASTMGVMSQSAEVVSRSGDLGGWLARNNRHMFPKRPKPPIQRRARLQRATGPGSYDEWKRELAADRAQKRAMS